MATAGRTVVVSGLTVSVALASLLIFPQFFLRSLAMGGIAAVLIAVLAAVSVLPALLAVLGPQVNACGSAPPDPAAPPARGRLCRCRWARFAGSVMRRPVLYIVVVSTGLLSLAIRSSTSIRRFRRASPAGGRVGACGRHPTRAAVLRRFGLRDLGGGSAAPLAVATSTPSGSERSRTSRVPG